LNGFFQSAGLEKKEEKMKKFLVGLFCSFLGSLPLAGGTLTASELIWAPVNPSFVGGNPLNGPFLLNSAQSQNDFKEPQSSKTPLQEFNETLNRQILYRLSSKIVETAFGETGLTPGHYTMGTFVVDVTEDAAGLTVSIVDTAGGGSTTVQVPYY
jgi:curli production assembly/transport component CsgF